MKHIIVFLIVGGCAVPISTPQASKPAALYAVMQPLCLFGCSNPVTTVREDILSSGNAPITSGAKTTTQSTAQGGPQ